MVNGGEIGVFPMLSLENFLRELEKSRCGDVYMRKIPLAGLGYKLIELDFMPNSWRYVCFHMRHDINEDEELIALIKNAVPDVTIRYEGRIVDA